ncbi:MAG: leucine-rich repeat domain-containing protein [Sodaliphilus sp.]|nr:leucine-rich repeat domain-containing protein [Sodaliphilus sp.]
MSVTEAGTLSTLIPASEKNAITSLTVSGTLNGTDIRFIREMAGLDIEGETTDGKLTELNIAGIELTDGGDAYYEDAWSKYYTATSYDVSEDNDLYYCTDLSYAFTGTNLTKVVWPATMWEVGENALAYCSDLKEFVLGSETNEIKPHAFSRCSGLEKITLTPKIIYIDEFAFSDCSSLKSIALPAGLEMLDKSCFLGCSSLASVTFGDVTEIREKVFYGCKALTNVVLPATLTKLDKAAFDGCSSLTEITLPKKLKTLGEAVFEGCTALEAINVAEGNASFASADGVLFNKAKTNLLAFPAGKTGAYAVPSGTEEIAASAFSRCVGLSAITLPETLTTIGDEVFYRCTGLTELTLPNSVTSIGESFVYRCSALKSVKLGSGISTIGESMFYYANGLESIDVPEGYTSIGYEAFYGCSALESFTIKVAAPIAITTDVFEDVDLNTCVLNVPEEGVEVYKADAQWGKFKNINGIMPSGVNDVVSSIDANVSVADGVLTIDGAKGDISVYNTSGVRLANGSERLSVTLSKGVYIVTLNGKATKVIVK